jgi:hypothetical protein
MPLQLKVVDSIENLQIVGKEKQFKKIKLQMGKTLDGNILITGHQSMNVIVIPDKGKIIAMPKGEFSNDVYTDQDQLFNHLMIHGVVSPESVIGGNIHGSLEAKFSIEKKGEEEPLDVVLLNLSNFINKEKQEYSVRKKFIDDLERELLSPDEESSTELGEIPQEKFKGSIPKYGFPTRGIYRYNY